MAVPKFQHRECSQILVPTVDTLNDIVNEWFMPKLRVVPELTQDQLEDGIDRMKREERTMKRRWPFVRRSAAERMEESRDTYRDWYLETTRSKEALQGEMEEMRIECSNAKRPWYPYPPGTKAVFRRSVDEHDIIAGEEYPAAAIRASWFSSSSDEPVLVLVDGYLRQYSSKDVRIVLPPEKPKRRRRRAK